MKLIKNGDRGTEVVTLQKALSSATDYFKGAWDGVFGQETESTVKKFQQQKGLAADGIVGEKTWSALGNHVPKDDSGSGENGEPHTAHFKMSEFKCKDGTSVPKEYWDNLQAIMNWLEKLRTACGNKAITVYSGYRTPSYNESVDGAKNSQHLYAAAADVAVSGMSPAEVYKIADKLFGNVGGVGKYPDFTHVDCRNNKARW